MFESHWKPFATSDLVARKTQFARKTCWKLDEIPTKESSRKAHQRNQWPLSIHFSWTMGWKHKTAPEEMITWTCPWWRLEHVTLCTYLNCVPISGFRTCTYYYPALVARQYGMKQQVPSRSADFLRDRISQRFVDHFRTTWQKRIIHSFTTSDWDSTTDKTYKQWVIHKQSH